MPKPVNVVLNFIRESRIKKHLIGTTSDLLKRRFLHFSILHFPSMIGNRITKMMALATSTNKVGAKSAYDPICQDLKDY